MTCFKADVILKYNPDEARNLKTYGELPENAKLNEGEEMDDNEVEFGMIVCSYENVQKLVFYIKVGLFLGQTVDVNVWF
jgi:hypothetical protein